MPCVAREPDAGNVASERTLLRERGELVYRYGEVAVGFVELLQFGCWSQPLIDDHGITWISEKSSLKLLRRNPRFRNVTDWQFSDALRKLREDGIYVPASPFKRVWTGRRWRTCGKKKILHVGDAEKAVEVFEHRLTIRREGRCFRMPLAVAERMLARKPHLQHGGRRPGSGRKRVPCCSCGGWEPRMRTAEFLGASLRLCTPCRVAARGLCAKSSQPQREAQNNNGSSSSRSLRSLEERPRASPATPFLSSEDGEVERIPLAEVPNPYLDASLKHPTTPRPPKLDPTSDAEDVHHLLRAYRNAIFHYARLGESYAGAKGLKPETRAILLEAAEALVQHRISPETWACYAIDAWEEHCETVEEIAEREGRPARDLPERPPLRWVWSAKRIESAARRAWDPEGEELVSDFEEWRLGSFFSGTRVCWGRSYRRAWTRVEEAHQSLQAALEQDATDSTLAALRLRYEIAAQACRREVETARARLEEAAARGVFLW